MRVRRLVDFPYVLVRLRCDACKRAGAYRLARLAMKYGSEILLEDLLARLSADCYGWTIGRSRSQRWKFSKRLASATERRCRQPLFHSAKLKKDQARALVDRQQETGPLPVHSVILLRRQILGRLQP
jgi:hypothetical protein